MQENEEPILLLEKPMTTDTQAELELLRFRLEAYEALLKKFARIVANASLTDLLHNSLSIDEALELRAIAERWISE